MYIGILPVFKAYFGYCSVSVFYSVKIKLYIGGLKKKVYIVYAWRKIHISIFRCGSMTHDTDLSECIVKRCIVW